MKQDTSKVLILTKEGVHRDTIRKSLLTHRFQADFCNSSIAAYQLLAASNSGIFLHDWDSLDKSQGIDLQRRISRMDGFSEVLRVVFAAEINPSLIALATDTNIRRVLSQATANLNLANELQMMIAAEKSTTDLQKKVRLLTQGSVGYHQDMVDQLIVKAYSQYAHDPQVKMEYAGYCFRSDKLPEADAVIDEILLNEPNNVRAMSLRSRIHMRNGQPELAAQILEHADVLSPRNPERLCALGESFYAMGKVDKAAKCFSKSLEIDPDNQAAQKGLGITKLDEGDANAALELFRQSLSEEEAAGFFNNAAVQAVRRGQAEQSLRLYETALLALKTDKLKPLVYFNLGLAQRRLGQLETALNTFRLALKYDASYIKAKQQIADIEKLLGRKAG